MNIPYLPPEILSKILFHHKGLQHPTSILIKNYFKQLDDNHKIYKHIIKKVENYYVEELNNKILVSSKEEFVVTNELFPRIFFIPDLDIVEEKIISYIL